MLPAHKAFGLEDLSLFCTINRLEVDLELPLLQRELHVSENHLLVQHLFAHLRIIRVDALQMAAMHLPLGEARAVDHLVDGQVDVLDGIDARIERCA